MWSKRSLVSYTFCLGLCVLVGFLPSSVTRDAVDGWYQSILKPDFTPPDWVFAPVWTLLYIMMGIAWGYINIYTKDVKLKKRQNILFVLQLFFNFIWSYIYFGVHEIGYAWVDLNLIIFFLILTIYYFAKTSKMAAMLLVPYFVWSFYASILNGSIWFLNR